MIQTYLEDFVALFYPHICSGCGAALMKGEEVICLGCLADLPKTNYHHLLENPVFQIFIGRANINFATSFCRFDKGGRLQHLLHLLKYKGSREVGNKLGLIFGYELTQSQSFKDIDAIIPVPLHPVKEKKRGYNQSTEICIGLAASMGKPMITDGLIREISNSTQTRKGRFERWENVSGIFKVNHPEKLKNKHLLLVDDVITTGATLEACCHPLLEISGVKVSVATIACA